LRRYWLDKKSFQGPLVQLEGDDFLHVCIVCRRGLGDQFEALSGDGRAHLVEIIEVRKKMAVAKIISVREMPPLPTPRVHLALSVPKLSVLESVLEKSVELGVQSFTVFRSDFSNIKGNTKNLEAKRGRLEKIIKSATQQSGRGDLMPLTLEVDLGVLLEARAAESAAYGLFAYEGDAPRALSEAVSEIKDKGLEDIWIFVGSEGGFSDRDIKKFSHSGMIPTSLGDQVLRVETACVTLVGVIKYCLGHFEDKK